MKHLKFILSVATLVFAMAVNAAVGSTFTVDTYTYKVLSDSTVAFKGLNADMTDVTVPATVMYDGTEYQVTEVADSAFFGNTAIQNVIISEGVNKIGIRVFYNATNLKTASVPRSVTSIGRNLFYGCTSLESMEFLPRITELPVSCFNRCESVKEITLPNTISSIGEYAFYGCKSLEMVYMSDKVTGISSDCFYELPNLKEIVFSPNSKLKTINTRAFNSLPSLERLSFPSTLTTFKYPPVSAWSSDGPIIHCPKLMEINIDNSKYKSFDGVVYSPDKSTLYFIPGGLESYTIDDNTKTIANHACVGGSIKTINFPQNLETIGRFSFCSCDNLTYLQFPVNLTTIKEFAFSWCESLGQVPFPEGSKLKTIEACAFRESGVTGELILPEGLENIEQLAFIAGPYAYGNYGRYKEGCQSLSKKVSNITKVVFPSSLKKIGHAAFLGCDIDSIKLHEGLEFIGDVAFACCKNLKYAYVPKTVTQTDKHTGAGIFNICENLSKVDWYAPILPQGLLSSCYSLPSFTIPDYVEEVGAQAFSYCTSIRLIKIPNSVKAIGKQAFQNCMLFTHVTLPSHLDNYAEGMIQKDDKIYEYTIPANITTPGIVGASTSTSIVDWNYNRLLNIFIMNDEIPDTLKRTKVYTSNKMDTHGKTTFFVKPSVYHEKYPDGKWSGTYIQDSRYSSMNRPVDFNHDVSYKIPLTMKNASGSPITYKTLCRDFDVDLSHTNDNLPEGVEPLRAYLVEDVDGDLRLVFLNEIKYIPSRLKANVTDDEGNLYPGVDEYVGVVLRGTPGYTYYYEMGEHDYTQGADGQWLMDDAMAYSGSSFEDNLMAGTANDDEYVYMTIENEDKDLIVNYGLNNGRFKIYYKDGWLNYNKSYLQLSKEISSAIEGETDMEGNVSLTFVFNNADGTTDKVSSVEFKRNSESDIFYNPYGQRVNARAKGIVINNGKKTINR